MLSLATSPTGSEASLTPMLSNPASDLQRFLIGEIKEVKPGGGLGVPQAGDVLSGDGQHGAVEVFEEGEEGGEGVELGGGDVAKVHWVEHHHHVLPAQRGEAHLVQNFRNGKKVKCQGMKLVFTCSSLLSSTELRVKSGARSPGRRQEADEEVDFRRDIFHTSDLCDSLSKSEIFYF